MTTARRLLGALIAVDVAGALVASRHRVAGEPLGIGATLDVRRPAVQIAWGTGLSAPLASLALAAMVPHRHTRVLRSMGLLFAVGAVSEPVFWGRRPCPWYGRALLAGHVALALGVAVTAR